MRAALMALLRSAAALLVRARLWLQREHLRLRQAQLAGLLDDLQQREESLAVDILATRARFREVTDRLQGMADAGDHQPGRSAHVQGTW